MGRRPPLAEREPDRAGPPALDGHGRDSERSAAGRRAGAQGRHRVRNPFYTGGADIPTFQPEELVATKLRALYQRKKGRDLYDLWLALTVLDLDPEAIVAAFPAYRPEGADGKLMADNLAAKLADKTFCTDIDTMVRVSSPAYDPQEAGKTVEERLLQLIL